MQLVDSKPGGTLKTKGASYKKLKQNSCLPSDENESPNNYISGSF